MAKQLNDAAINRAANEVAEAGVRRDISDAREPGLRLRLTPAGSKTWVLACRDPMGRMRRFPLGAYPALSITEARAKARQTHQAVKYANADPIADRRRSRADGSAQREGLGTLR